MKAEKISLLSKIFSAIVAIVGLILFIGSFTFLRESGKNENLSKVAKRARLVTDHTQAQDGKIIYMEGMLEAETYAKDMYLLDDNYVLIERIVDFYAYEELRTDDPDDTSGGFSAAWDKYKYKLQWVWNPLQTSDFSGASYRIPKISDKAEYDARVSSYEPVLVDGASGLSIGPYPIKGNIDCRELEVLTLSEDNVCLGDLPNASINDNYIFQSFRGDSSFANPKIGDMRISYRVVRSSKSGLLFGTFSGQIITEFKTARNNEVLKFFSGLDDKAIAIDILKRDYKSDTWVGIFIGFIMMFIGLLAMLSLIGFYLRRIPIFSRVSGGVFFLLILILAVALTGLTVLLTMAFNNFWSAIAIILTLIVLIILGILLLIKKAKSRQESDLQSKMK